MAATNSVLQNKWALVTGASSGLGVDFAKQLAAMGCNLVLVARREDRLRSVADELKTTYKVQAEIITLDLAQPDASQALYDQLKAQGKQIDVLVNNAGYGLYGEFVKVEWEREKQMMMLDVMTVVHLTKLFLQDMVQRDFGYVLQVASIGAYQPTPLYSTYSASKSFVLFFSEAVSYELRNTNVKVTTVSPGVTKTEFLQVSGQQATLYQRLMMMKSEDVVRIALKAMLRGTPSLVPGLMNALTIFSNRFMPRRLAAALAYRTMQQS